MKKVIRNIFLISLCLVLVTGCGKKEKIEKKENKQNKTVVKSKNVIKEQTVDGLKINNVNLTVSDGITTYTAGVTNTTEKDVVVEDIDVIVKNKKGNELVSLIGYIGGTIKPNETKNIISTTDMDLKKADSITYKVNKK